MKLTELQQVFATDIQWPDSTETIALIDNDAKGSAAERLFIYQHAYFARLQETLQTDYPGLYAYIGAAEFKCLARAYSQGHSSQNPSLRWFGQFMADFLQQTAPYQNQPVLSEITCFEWALGLSFDAADSLPLSLADLHAIPPEQWGDLRIEFAPSVQLLDLRWNTPQIWQALDQQQEPPKASQQEYPVCWLIWRRELSPHWRSLPVDEAWALAELQAGGNLAGICAGLTEWVDEAYIPQRLLELLSAWMEEGLICGLRGNQ